MSFNSSSQAVPTRTLVVHAKKLPWWLDGLVKPIVLVNGHRYPLNWGTYTFTIPADRPVHVQCLMPHFWPYGKAEVVVEPSREAELEYSPPSSRLYPGEIGPPGTTKSQGAWISYGMLGACGLALMGHVAWLLVVMGQH